MELNIRELLKLVLTKWWVILLCVVILGSCAFIYTKYFIEPVYEANTTLYIGKDANEPGVNTTALNIGSSVVSDYREIAKSRLVISTVIRELGLIDLDIDELKHKIRVDRKTDTRVIEISVNDHSPELAMEIANKVAEVFKEKITEIMQIENVQVIDTAVIPTDSISPSSSLILMIMLFVGFFIGVVIVILIEYFDNTIKTPEDIKKYLNLPVIGAIPTFKIEGKEV